MRKSARPTRPLAKNRLKIVDMTSEKEPEICILKTHELLSKAQLLQKDIQELLDWCTSTGTSYQTRCRTIQQECQITIEGDGETLVIGGFRFESATTREGLRSLKSQASK